MALLGISRSLEEGMSFDSLSEPQVLKLIKLALKEFDLPNWFGELIERYPEPVASEVWPRILNELDTVEADTSQHPSFFSNIIREYPQSVDLFQAELFDWAKKHMPLSQNIRTHIVNAFSEERYRGHIKFLAEEHLKVNDRKESSKDGKIFWLAVWLQVDAVKALDKLEEILGGLESKQAEEFVLHLSNILYHGHGSETGFQGRPDYQSLEALSRLIPIVFSHIRFEDDRVREGTWTPDERDNAQYFRNELVESLAKLPGKGAFIALQRIGKKVHNKRVKDWLLRLMEEKIDRESPLVWHENKIVEFERRHECGPLTVDDLFEIGLKRIGEIKNNLETGDYSLRELFSESAHESQLQKFLAQRLKELSRGRYSVVREPEVDNKKEPDIRLLHQDLPPVSIEVKWAHKWKLGDLEDGLENQLFRQYLKAADSTHGIYLLVNAKSGQTWSVGSTSLDFYGLIDHLRALARKI